LIRWRNTATSRAPKPQQQSQRNKTGGHGLLPIAAEIYGVGLSVEEVRKYLEETYTTRVAQGGLKVYTTINVEAQKLATKAIREGLRKYDRGRGWRSEYQNILLDENNQPITDEKTVQSKLNTFKHADWYGDEYEKGEFIKGLVVNVNPARDEATISFRQV
jgi:penicillin-binding protein 1A